MKIDLSKYKGVFESKETLHAYMDREGIPYKKNPAKHYKAGSGLRRAPENLEAYRAR